MTSAELDRSEATDNGLRQKEECPK